MILLISNQYPIIRILLTERYQTTIMPLLSVAEHQTSLIMSAFGTIALQYIQLYFITMVTQGAIFLFLCLMGQILPMTET